jgi:hypothetical protein
MPFGGGFGFALGDYDKNNALVIDPLVFSSYFGGDGADEITGLQYFQNGEFVVSGWTNSTNFQTTPGVYDETFNNETDSFIAKYYIRGTSSGLIFSSIIGGSGSDVSVGLGLDPNGNIYLAGSTDSKDFPLVSPISPDYVGKLEVFISKFSPDGTQLIYSSFFGGKNDDKPHAIKVDRNGSAYISGETESRDFPVKTQYKIDRPGLSDIFVAKISQSGAAFDFSTLIGGSSYDRAFAFDIDNEGSVYLTGETSSGDFPIVPYKTGWGGNVTDFPYDYTYNGGTDCFLVKLTGSGSKLEYSGFFGGTSDDV